MHDDARLGLLEEAVVDDGVPDEALAHAGCQSRCIGHGLKSGFFSHWEGLVESEAQDCLNADPFSPLYVLLPVNEARILKCSH